LVIVPFDCDSVQGRSEPRVCSQATSTSSRSAQLGARTAKGLAVGYTTHLIQSSSCNENIGLSELMLDCQQVGYLSFIRSFISHHTALRWRAVDHRHNGSQCGASHVFPWLHHQRHPDQRRARGQFDLSNRTMNCLCPCFPKCLGIDVRDLIVNR
jgi:hypothetical protein